MDACLKPHACLKPTKEFKIKDAKWNANELPCQFTSKPTIDSTVHMIINYAMTRINFSSWFDLIQIEIFVIFYTHKNIFVKLFRGAALYNLEIRLFSLTLLV